MTAPGLSRAAWRESAHRGGRGGNCAEVSDNLPEVVAVRDSEDRQGQALLFTSGQRLTWDRWRAFAAGVKSPQLRLG